MAKRKNVLLILSDQQRLDTVSAYGMNNICKTPHIDQLAAEGMKFTNAYTSSAICAPLSGQRDDWPVRPQARCDRQLHRHPRRHPLLGDCMHDAGYYCGYAGKWHVSPTLPPEELRL